MSTTHIHKPEQLSSQFNKLPYQARPELQKIIKSLGAVFTSSSKSLIQTHQIIAKTPQSATSSARLNSWHNELKDSVESFKKKFSRLIGDLRYFLQTSPADQSNLERISNDLKNKNLPLYSGYLLKTELQELVPVVDNSIVTPATNQNYTRNVMPSTQHNHLKGTRIISRSVIGQSPARVTRVNIQGGQIVNPGTPTVKRISYDNISSHKRISSLTKSGRRRGSIRSKVVVENVSSRPNSVESCSSKAAQGRKEDRVFYDLNGSVTKKPPQIPLPGRIGGKMVERVEVARATPRERSNSKQRSSMTKTKVEKEIVSSAQLLSNTKVKTKYHRVERRSVDRSRRRSSQSRSHISIEKTNNQIARDSSKASRRSRNLSNNPGNVLEPIINLQPIDPPSQKKNRRRESVVMGSGSKNRNSLRGSNHKRGSLRMSKGRRDDKENQHMDPFMSSKLDITGITNKTSHIIDAKESSVFESKVENRLVCGEYVRYLVNIL